MRVVHCMKDRYTHYIGRPHKDIPKADWGPFGNPFPLVHESRRDAVLKRYEAHARGTPELLDAIKALPKDAVLGCWCAPKLCHGDIIVRLWRELHGEDSI